MTTQMPNKAIATITSKRTSRHIRAARTLAYSAILFILLLLAGCSEEGNSSPNFEGPANEAFPLQPTSRFPVGATFYLPGVDWTLTESPTTNTNALFTGDNDVSRFTPIVTGEYSFTNVEGLTQRIGVVDAIPYEHYNYYPNSSVTRVGDEIWVAHVFDAHISRIQPETGEVLGTIATGPWPVAIAWAEGMNVAVVAQKAGDTLGIIDIASNQLIDAIWVGDEPADVVTSPDGRWAYVSLTTDDAVARVSLEERALIDTLPTNSTPSSLAMNDDGTQLFVASYRSGKGDRLDGTYDEKSDLYDVAIVATAKFVVTGYLESVGSNINAIHADGDRLYVATTRVSPAENNSLDPNNMGFRHTVAAYDVAARTEIASADIGRQPSAPDYAVRPFGLVRLGDHIWVTVEGSDLLLGLDSEDLSEVARYEVTGRPRSLMAHNGKLFVHGVQSYVLLNVNPADGTNTTIALSGDPRPADVAGGQYIYTGHGEYGGANHSCAECHIDGLTDGNQWRAGVFDYSSVPRPFFWMEGTSPLGWPADGADLYSYTFGVPGPTMGVKMSNEFHSVFYAYLAALVPPPAANGKTRLDGSMTEMAVRGREVFEDAGRCAGCHMGPLTTNRMLYPEGITSTSPTDVPSLVGAYRHAYWFIDGSTRDMGTTVDYLLPYAGAKLDSTERDDLTRYLEELTTREFFVLASKPEENATSAMVYGPNDPIKLIFSHPVLDQPKNLSRIRLVDDANSTVPTTVHAALRHVELQPTEVLAANSHYSVVVEEAFEAFNEMKMGVDTRIPFKTAVAPALQLEGEYVLTIYRPGLNVETKAYDPNVIIPIETPLVATPTPFGADVVATLNAETSTEYKVVIEGTDSHWPALIMPLSGDLMGKSFPTQSELTDEDGDGIADTGEGTLFFRSPGLEAEDVEWTIHRPEETSDAVCGTVEGNHEVVLEFAEDGSPTIQWEADVDALGYYVTDPEATTPVGPGVVKGGAAYWVLQTPDFPNGFRGPIRYGIAPENSLDVTEDSGGLKGGSPLPETGCVKLTIGFSDFSLTVITYEP
ncbi:MAG: hypothetical protein CMH54_08330 [Myxococcales bacterium]|nr:hypothetical protein [Myxococcales bacterium]